MNYLRLIILLSLIVNIGCSTQKLGSKKQWFKGNLHAHSYWSDGDEFPEVIMDWYKSKEYQFVALTDHNTLADGDRWQVISKDSMYQKAFKRYLEQYGASWVTYKTDSLNRTQVKLKTYEEYKGLFEESGKFLIIKAEEISDHFEDKPLHLNTTNIQKKIHPQGGNSVLEVLQNNIDAVISQRDELNIPMIVHVNHPNFRHAISLEDMIALRNERFFEVYNGHHLVNNSGDSIHMSTESMWDHINIAYIKNNKPLMYGLATDDSHNYHVKGSTWSNAGRGWIMARADSLNPKSLIAAMEAGEFYASTGVEIKELIVDNNTLTVEVKKEPGITYQISFIGCKKGKAAPEEFVSVQGGKANFEITNDILFVRSKIISSKLHENPIEDLLYESAWTQPVQPIINR
ncbi:histidinol-phosphatase [Flavobacteriaceae bacterium KMM 6897]|nr:histidinol-phosphatase [Flavobacteriaceae bacterium KMM 6897]